MTDYYKELGIEKSATLEEVKKAYRTLAMLHHPDRGGNQEKFKKIAESYEILSDTEKRRSYDTFGKVEPGLNQGGNFPSELFSMFFNGGGFPNMFSGQKVQSKGQSIVHTLELTLEELYTGKNIVLSCSKKNICGKCQGKGASNVIKCKTCNGSGQCLKHIQLGPFMMQQMISKCDHCDKGNIVDPANLCDKCNGNKVVQENEIIKVDIAPKNIDNRKIVLENKADQYPDTIPGDVILIIKEKQHPVFTREGKNLKLDKNISLKQALCGIDFNITHLDGRTIFIKKDGVTCDNYIQTIPHDGMNQDGSLIITYHIEFPATLTQEQHDCIKRNF